jgi:hypothetical protein
MLEERSDQAGEAGAGAGALVDGSRPTGCCGAEREPDVRQADALGNSQRRRRQEPLPTRFRDPLPALLPHPVSSIASFLARRERTVFSADVLRRYEASLETLADQDRLALSLHWLRRARSEARISLAFSQMLPLLREVGAAEVVLDLIELSAADELRHSEVCVHVAGRYAGRALEHLPVGETPLPAFGCSDERLEVAVLVAGTCCINETLATVWLELGIAAARTPLTRAAHRAHLRDEVDHARAGWAHLASSALDNDLRAELGGCLSRLLAANLPLWLDADPLLPVDGVRGHGAAHHLAIERAMKRAVREILLPGFELVGVPVGEECRREYGADREGVPESNRRRFF